MTLKPDRDAFKIAVAKTYPDIKPGAIPNNAGQLFRFVHEVKSGDLVVYPSKLDRHVHIGRVAGDYRYDSTTNGGYPHQRPVKWLSELPRTTFSQGALYEIGSAISFFRVKTYVEEFRAAAEGKVPSPAVMQDEAGALVDLEETGHDQIAKLISAKFKGHGLARLVNAILKAQGYTTYLSPEGTDAGIDILAGAEALGFSTPRICVQVKSQDSPIGRPEVDQLMGAMDHTKADAALFVSWGGFKPTVYKELASRFFRVRLWSQKELLEHLFANYDRLDEDLRAELPLKRIWTVATQEKE
jgi:restriction system protein